MDNTDPPMMVFIRNLFRYQLVRFLFVGLINTLVGYGCFALLMYMGLHYTVALFVATVFGVFFNFKSIGVGVFRSHNNYLVFRFVAIYAVVYLINIGGIKALSYVGLDPYIGGAVLLLPMAILAFILNKRFVFLS